MLRGKRKAYHSWIVIPLVEEEAIELRSLFPEQRLTVLRRLKINKHFEEIPKEGRLEIIRNHIREIRIQGIQKEPLSVKKKLELLLKTKPNNLKSKGKSRES